MEFFTSRNPISSGCFPVFHFSSPSYHPTIGFKMIEKLVGFGNCSFFFFEINNHLIEVRRSELLFFGRSEEHTSELHHVRISYAVFCLKKKRMLRRNTRTLT